MKSLNTWAAAAVVAAAQSTTWASPVTFNFDTTVVDQQPAPDLTWPAPLGLGQPVHVAVTFDAAAAFLRTRNDANGNATIFDYSASSLAITLSGNGFSNTQTFASFGGGLMRLRDDSPDPDGLGGVVDGMTLQLINTHDPNVQTVWSLTLRGLSTDLIHGGALPTTQDARWASQRVAKFQLCRSAPAAPNSCNMGAVTSQVNAVPAPATWVLALTALIGLGASRSRRGLSI